MVPPTDQILHVFVFTLSFFASLPLINSDLLEANVDFHVDGEGFHRKINYLVEIPNLKEKDCHVALYVELPSSLYVNVDELADLRRTGQVTACSEGETDVEIFAEEAKTQNVTVCSNLVDNKSLLTLLVHQRYHRATVSADFVSVILPKPKLLVGCKKRIKEYLVSKIDLCKPCVDFSIKWREIPFNSDTEDYEWKIPVGDLSQRHYVTCITLFTTSVGTIFVLKSLWGSTGRERQKID